MDVFPPGFVGPLSLEYDTPGRLAHLTAKIVDTATESVIFNGVPTGLAEVEAGIYAADAYTYPTRASIYRRTWYDDLVLVKGSADEFRISYSAASLSTPSGDDYLTIDELKASLSMTGQSYADDDMQVAITAASRGLEDAYETYWRSPATDTRYYTRSGSREVHLGDLLSFTTVALDYSYSDLYQDGRVWDWDTGLGTYSTILDPAWFRLLPIQNGPSGNGEPYQTLQLTRASQRLVLPTGQDAIRVAGTFGWMAIPAGVKTAVTMIASRLLRRTREAPFGILAVGAEGAAIRARDIANDPDIRFVMGPAAGTSSLFV